MKRALVLVGGVAGCGHTIPEPKEHRGTVDTAEAPLGHAPELVGFSLDFELAAGRQTLVASSRLGDIDDNLVPDGTVNAMLLDGEGVERTVFEGIAIGSPPTELPEVTLLRIPFSIANDASLAWEVRVQVFDRDGLASEMQKAVWTPPDLGDDTGSGGE